MHAVSLHNIIWLIWEWERWRLVRPCHICVVGVTNQALRWHNSNHLLKHAILNTRCLIQTRKWLSKHHLTCSLPCLASNNYRCWGLRDWQLGWLGRSNVPWVCWLWLLRNVIRRSHNGRQDWLLPRSNHWPNNWPSFKHLILSRCLSSASKHNLLQVCTLNNWLFF